MDHPPAVALAAPGTCGIEDAVHLDRKLMEACEQGRSDSLVFQYPTEPLYRGTVELERILNNPVHVELGAAGLESVEHFGDIAAVLRREQAVEECPFRIGDLDPGFVDPDILDPKETFRLNLYEPVDRTACRIPIFGVLLLPSRSRHRPRGGQDEQTKSSDEIVDTAFLYAQPLNTRPEALHAIFGKDRERRNAMT